MKVVDNTARLEVENGVSVVAEVHISLSENELMNLLMIAKKALKDTEGIEDVSLTFKALIDEYRKLHNELQMVYYQVRSVSLKAKGD